MKQFRKNDLPSELADVARRLEGSRPTLDEGSADAMVSRIVRRNVQERTTLRTRIAIVAMLVLGFAFSGSAVGLAISGSTSSQTAAQSQYGPPGGSGVLGENGSGGNGSGTTSGTQPAQQQTVESGAANNTSSLPFTGFAAIPVLIIGMALLGGGFVLRHRTKLD
jgi:hypothetical protein